MPVERTLWRCAEMTPANLRQPEQWAGGLQLHLQHAPLTSITMRISAQQQSYVALDGCGACLRNACRVGCRVALLRRLITGCFEGGSLHAVAAPQGLATRPYTRVALARPCQESEPLQETLLASWEDARLSAHWQSQGRELTVATLLAVGQEGPDPAATLRAIGWKPIPLPIQLGRHLAGQALPPALPFGAAWSGSVCLFMSVAVPDAGTETLTSVPLATSVGA